MINVFGNFCKHMAKFLCKNVKKYIFLQNKTLGIIEKTFYSYVKP